MKKVLASIMGLAFATSAMAQYLIYDYKVNFTRVDPAYVKVAYEYCQFDAKKADDQVGIFDTFKTDTDTLDGMVIIPACGNTKYNDCNGKWQSFGSASFAPAVDDDPEDIEDESYDSFIVYEDEEYHQDAIAYITRGDDALYKNPNGTGKTGVKNKLVWKLYVNLDAAMFGKGVGSRLPNGHPCIAGTECEDYENKPTGLQGLKEAWMILTYDIDRYFGKDTEIMPPVKGVGKTVCKVSGEYVEVDEYVVYGFMGYQSTIGSISNAGFGTLTKQTIQGQKQDYGFCGGGFQTPGKTCVALNKLKGSVVGIFLYDGFCNVVPMFDICSLANKNEAPISGTYTFNLNSANSRKYGATLSTAIKFVEGKYGAVSGNNLIDCTVR